MIPKRVIVLPPTRWGKGRTRTSPPFFLNQRAFHTKSPFFFVFFSKTDISAILKTNDMKITAIKTQKITDKNKNIYDILDKYIPAFKEKSVLAVTSKIIAICEGRIIKINKADKNKLVEQEADYFLPASSNAYNFYLTIKNNLLVATAGIDESNGNGYYVFWPRNLQKSADDIRNYLIKKFSLKSAGVIITDSKTTPQRWGVTGAAIAHSGFFALNDYREKPDIFGKKLKVTQVNVADGLAAAAVLVMGEGNEQTPLAIVEDVSFVKFQKRNPTEQELKALQISIEEDLYSPLLTSVKWQKGRKNEIQ